MKKTIFIVDDVDTNLTMAVKCLENYYRIFTMLSAAKMFALLEKIKPDLILLDIEMPEMDGFEALSQLKSNASYAEIPVIFLTGLANENLEVLGFERGVIDFIAKPFSAPVLQNRIKSHLGIDELIRERTAQLEELKNSYMKATAEAENALEAKRRFIANMSHEMRTPMNVIVGLTDLVLEENGVSANTKEALQKISVAGNTLTRLINDVLDISKIEAGTMELNPVQYDTADILNDIIELNKVHIADKPIAFTPDIAEDLPSRLYGDNLRVEQILNNLLSNAFKYTKEGNVTLGVNAEKATPAPQSLVPVPQSLAWVTFTVSDTGIGIRLEHIDKLFTDYSQVDTKASRENDGSGFGLRIAKRFVELMGGEISLESEFGKGTVFRVRILQGIASDTPIGKETAENLSTFRYAEKKKQAQAKLMRPDLSYARVLVVDDFAVNLDVAAGVLRKYKMTVDCASNGREAVNLIAAGTPVYNAVFMDHMMPVMDGMAATAAIRALDGEYAKNIPIIALTANAVAGSERMFLDNGFNAFLAKPFNMKGLDSVVQQWVKEKEK
jgi:signal transduction histidine kinase